MASDLPLIDDVNGLIGETYRDAWRGAYGGKGRLHHVRGVVDGMLVVRTWFRCKQRWHYDIVHLPGYAFDIGAIRKPSPRLRVWLEADLAAFRDEMREDTSGTAPREEGP